MLAALTITALSFVCFAVVVAACVICPREDEL